MPWLETYCQCYVRSTRAIRARQLPAARKKSDDDGAAAERQRHVNRIVASASVIGGFADTVANRWKHVITSLFRSPGSSSPTHFSRIVDWNLL
ncbi:MAG: hypothetical protein V3V08_05170 [Nannocystaceae bacterium]